MTLSLLQNDFVGRSVNRPRTDYISDLSLRARRKVIYDPLGFICSLKRALHPDHHCWEELIAFFCVFHFRKYDSQFFAQVQIYYERRKSLMNLNED